MKAKIEKMLKKYGKPITVMYQSGSTYNTATSENVPAYTNKVATASIENYKAFQVGGLIQYGDLKVTVVLDSAPDTKDKLLIDGVQYRVVFVDAAFFKESAAAYIIQARR